MNRRDMGKGVLGFFASLVCGIPFVKGKERVGEVTGVVGTVKKQALPIYTNELDTPEYTIIKWTSVEDELPKETDSANERFYLLGYDSGRVSTVSSCELCFYNNPKNHPNLIFTRWSLLPKNSHLLSVYSPGQYRAKELRQIIDWTSVKDELPKNEKGKWCFVRFDGEAILTVESESVRERIERSVGESAYHEITHWAHLPKV